MLYKFFLIRKYLIIIFNGFAPQGRSEENPFAKDIHKLNLKIEKGIDYLKELAGCV